MINPKSAHTYLVTTANPGHRMAEGIGCNMLLSNQSSVPSTKQAQPWRRVIDALDDLKVGWMRVGVIPTAGDGSWNDRRQRWNFEHPHFDAVKKLAQWAKRRGVRLMFDPFVIPESFRQRKDVSFADDPRDYAAKLILPVAQFFRDYKLDAFRYLGLLNEKIWGPGKEGFAAVKPFHDLYRAVRDVLDENGITADQLGLLGPSNLSSWEWPISDFFAAGLDPDPLWVGYDQHLYLYQFDWMPENHPDFFTMSEMTERYLRRYADYAHKRNKPLFITELGNMYCGRLFWGERDFDGPASHTSVLLDAELIVRGINEGVDGFLRWAFSVKGDCDGRWSLLENTPRGMEPTANVYPMYKLLMRAVRPGCQIISATVGAAEAGFRYVHAAAVIHPDGNACLLLINDLPGKNINVGLALAKPFRGAKILHRSICDETRKCAAREPIVMNRKGEGEVVLSGSSLTVLSLNELI